MPHQLNLNFIESNISLKEKSYYKMGGIARHFASPQNLNEIVQTISFAKKQKLPIAILGSGSNCVFSDDLFKGVVISLEKLSSWWWETDKILFAEGGVTNTEIAEICLAAERGGASWMYRMPGQIGASVRMNARCYGGEMSQIVKEILTIDTNGHLNVYNAKEILIGYKNTLLMNTPEIVVGVRFYFDGRHPGLGECHPGLEECHPGLGECHPGLEECHPGLEECHPGLDPGSSPPSAQDILSHMQQCEQDRHSKQHFLFPSCGSTFKNNYSYGKPSGRIFDELGLKGTRRGDAEVSAYHGNFIWNKKEATSKDMLHLSAFMRNEAKQKLGVVLDLEVQPIGSFTQEEFESAGMENLGPHVQIGGKYFTGLFYMPQDDSNTVSSRDTSMSSRGLKGTLPREQGPRGSRGTRLSSRGTRLSSRGARLSSRGARLSSRGLTAGSSRIFSSFFMNYFHEKIFNLPDVHVELHQLQSLVDAQKNPAKPFLRWTTFCKNFENVFHLKPQSHDDCQKLWEFSVSEIFLAHPEKSEYLECEMTPYGHALKLNFSDVRTLKMDPAVKPRDDKRAPRDDNPTPRDDTVSSRGRAAGASTFGMEFCFNDLKDYIKNNHIRIQCALSLGNSQYFLAPYWTKHSTKKHKADFHQPSEFWILNLL